MPPQKYMKVHQDVATGLVTVTFYPCRHAHTYRVEDVEACSGSVQQLEEFAAIHKICWDCHFAREAPDA